MDYELEMDRILAEVQALYEELLRVKLSQRFYHYDKLSELGLSRMIENAVGLTERQAREQVNAWLEANPDVGLTLEVTNGQVSMSKELP